MTIGDVLVVIDAMTSCFIADNGHACPYYTHTHTADDNPVRYRALTSAPIFEAVRKTYWDNVSAHARGRPANHVSIVGDERSCMTWFLYPDSAPIGTDPPVVRFVKVPAKEATTVMELGRALGEHPRTRFVVVVDTLDMQTANDAYSQLSDVLTGAGGVLCSGVCAPTRVMCVAASCCRTPLTAKRLSLPHS